MMHSSRSTGAEVEGTGRRPAVDVTQVFLLVGLGYVVLKVGLLAMLAWNTQFVMDELSQAGYSINIPLGFYEQIDPIKTVLYVFYYLGARVVTDSAVGLVHVARLQTVALAIGILGLVYATARNLRLGRPAAVFSVCLLVSFSTFMERSFRIRSDSVALFLACVALWVATRESARPRTTAFVTGLLLAAAFGCTQKSAYFAVAFGLAYVALWVGSLGKEGLVGPAFVVGVTFGVGWLAGVGLYGLAFGGRDALRVLGMVFSSPMQVALHGDEFYGEGSWFLTQTLRRNIVAYVVSGFGVVVSGLAWRRLDSPARFVWVVTAVMVVFVSLHNQPWPYVYLMALVFASLSAGLAFDSSPSSAARRHAVMLVALIAMLPSLGRNVAYLENDNLSQALVMAQAESLLGPGDRYADGVGMVTTRRVATGTEWWDAMGIELLERAGEAGDHSAFDEIFVDEPKVWIFNYRVRTLLPYLSPYLRDAYVRVYPNVLLAGTEMSGAPRRFRVWWGGSYRLVDSDGRPVAHRWTLNGRTVSDAVDLEPGVYQVALDSDHSGVAYLLPADVDIGQRLPVVGQPFTLFADVYTY